MPDATVSLLICDDHKVLTDALSMVVGVGMKVFDSCSRPMIPMRIAGMLYG